MKLSVMYFLNQDIYFLISTTNSGFCWNLTLFLSFLVSVHFYANKPHFEIFYILCHILVNEFKIYPITFFFWKILTGWENLVSMIYDADTEVLSRPYMIVSSNKIIGTLEIFTFNKLSPEFKPT